MPIAYRSILRHAFMSSLFFLPPKRKVPLERRLRGREERRKLGLADVVIVSFGKSGRTWLRVMLSRVYQVKHGLAQRHLIGFDNLHAKNRQIPRVFFTHDNYLKDFTGHADHQGGLLRQEGRTPRSQSRRCCGIAVFPMEVPDAADEEGD